MSKYIYIFIQRERFGLYLSYLEYYLEREKEKREGNETDVDGRMDGHMD